MDAKVKVERAAHGVAASPPVRWLGRFGGACYGVVHLVVAWLALRIAFGDRAAEADQRGAVEVIAAQPLGSMLLWIMTAGLVAFAAWQLLYSGTGFRWVGDKRVRLTRRLATAGRAVVALVIASFALRLLTHGGAGADDQEMAARLLGLRGGRVLVMVLGLGVVAAGVLSATGGLARRFLHDLDGMSERARRVVEVLGALGYLAKAVAFAVIGVLLCTAAVRVDPRQAGGLDRALRALAAQPYGIVLLTAVAIGFVAFGLYCLADARYRRGG
jgi:lysylphosphatidylglycerol synthetase-like protein (DUF2156 family)